MTLVRCPRCGKWYNAYYYYRYHAPKCHGGLLLSRREGLLKFVEVVVEKGDLKSDRVSGKKKYHKRVMDRMIPVAGSH